MKRNKNTQSNLLIFAAFGVLCFAFLSTPHIAFGQNDVSPIDAVTTATPGEEPAVTPTPVDDTSSITPTVESPSLNSNFTWNYSIEFPKVLLDQANEFTTGLNQFGIQAGIPGNDTVQMSGSNDLNAILNALFPQNNIGFGILDGASEMYLTFPISANTPVRVTVDSNLSTGYSWQVASAVMNNKVLQSSIHYVARGTGVLPQKEVISFTSATSGTAKVKLVYRRSAKETEPASRSLTLTLNGTAQDIDLSNPHPDLSGQLTDTAAARIQNAGGNLVAADSATLPNVWDWRIYGGVTPVRDQGYYGSCWAFSTTGASEASILVNGGPSLNLSEQFLISCNNEGWTANSGGYPVPQYHKDELAQLQTVPGAVLESDLPYLPSRTSCKKITNHNNQIANWSYFTYSSADTNLIKSAIYTHGPVSAAVCVGPKFSAYAGGYYSTDESATCNGSINHYIVLVGWKDVSATEGYWILRNSWGSSWGENGYMYIKYGTSNVGTWASWVDYLPVNSPTTLAPSGQVQSMTPIFQWNVTSGATDYEVQVVQNGTTLTTLVDNTFASSVCSGTTCSAKLSKPISNGDYYWRARAKINSVWQTYTRPMAFSVVNQPPATPVTLTPSGNQTTRPATFTWKPSVGATQYLLNVYSYATKSTVLTKTVNASSICTSTTCTYRPGYTYVNDVYQFTVTAKNSYGSSAASSARRFSFCSTNAIYSPFNGNSACWFTYTGGSWSTNTTSYYSAGKANVWSSSAYPVNFSNFIYQARIKLTSTATTAEAGLIFRGTNTVTSTNRWKNGYFLTYKNNGTFKVSKMVNGTEVILQNWKTTTAIKKNDWNLLKVSVKSTAIACYINGVLVWKGTDSSFSSGNAGLTFFNGGSGQIFYADYATLTKQ